MSPVTEPKRYHIYLDYKGYMIDSRSFKVYPAPLMGTRFATGRMAYSNLDFWQIGALTDFTKGMNQKFLVDPSTSYKIVGVDCSQEGEFRLERELETQAFPTGKGFVTARYRSINAHYVGTSFGRILKTTDGLSFNEVKNTGNGKIYGFFEMENDDGNSYLYAMKGPNRSWRMNSGGTWEECNGSGSKPLIINLYFVMIESDYAYGMFNDGIRQSINGEDWIPAPPDPLWELPDSEGEALNALPITRGFLIGAQRGLWIFIGGGSAVNLWLFPDYTSADNFRGMDKFGPYGVFSIEGQGLFYTDGSGIFPTNLNWSREGVPITSCKSILTSGWDMFALVSDGDKWFLARCNMRNTKLPKHWWMVKELSKEPVYLSSYSKNKLFIHYKNGTCDVYDKEAGPYQSSGYLTTSWIDENMILLQKLYKSLNLHFSSFPESTTAVLSYIKKDGGTEISETFIGDKSNSKSFDLENPTLSSKIQITATLTTSDSTISPVVTDLTWKYILERPLDETSRKRNWFFTVICQDDLEKLDADKEEAGLELARTRQDIVDAIWATRSKQEILNYVGVDNDPKDAFSIQYSGSGSSCKMKIDRTNFKITTEVDGKEDQSISYKNLTIANLAGVIDALGNYSCVQDVSVPQNKTAHDLVPVNDVEIKGKASVYWGRDVHAVIFNPQSPSQIKLSIEGRGGDRFQISLRES